MQLLRQHSLPRNERTHLPSEYIDLIAGHTRCPQRRRPLLRTVLRQDVEPRGQLLLERRRRTGGDLLPALQEGNLIAVLDRKSVV